MEEKGLLSLIIKRSRLVLAALPRGALIGGLAAAAVVGAGGWRYARLVDGPTMAKLKPTTRGLMLRDYLQHALCDSSSGYFSRPVLQRVKRPPRFSSLGGEPEYRELCRDLYGAGCWATPSELFQPYYAEAIGRSILERHRKLYGTCEPLQLVELGGGHGTNAEGILRWLSRDEPEVFGRCRYLLYEVSPLLAQAQQERLSAAGLPPERFEVRAARPHFPVSSSDGKSAEGLLARHDGPWWVIALELLDNLAHDKLRLRPCGEEIELLEARVHPTEHPNEDHGGSGGGWIEELHPLSDPTLAETGKLIGVDTYEGISEMQRAMLPPHQAGSLGGSLFGGLQQSLHQMLRLVDSAVDVYVPTGAWLLLQNLARAFPEHQLTLADFNWLELQPDGGVNAPVVQRQRGPKTYDLGGDYLLAPGEADVIFPTHFESIAALHAATMQGKGPPAQIWSTAEFMNRYAELSSTRTLSGYNPLVEDFTNTAFMITGGAHQAL